MRKSINFKGIEVSYNDYGSGTCMFFLHGYLENAEVWDEFLSLFTGRFRVIAMDIPGHGLSGCWGREHGMQELSDAVKLVVDHEGLEKVILVGHSMGGYVVLEFASRYPGRLYGYVLFHSSCFPDTGEKKKNRDREISLILCGRKRQIINVNIPKAFADSNLDRLESQVLRCQEIAHQSEDEGVIALLNGMKKRSDHSRTLGDGSLPLMLIGGEKDNYIPMEVFEKLVQMAPHASILRLKESGHMGFIEEPELSSKALIEFAMAVSA